MKKAILAAAAIGTSIVALPAAADAQQRTIVREGPNRTVVVQRGPGYQNRQVVRHNNRALARQQVRYAQPRFVQQRVVQQRFATPGYQYRQWQRGQHFNRAWAPNYRVIDHRAYYGRGLYAPPRGHQWVQSGNDAVLIAVATGLIGAVIGGAIF
ncbi:RcnB family protein [Sphingomonas sp.]